MKIIIVGIVGFGLSGKVFHASLIKECSEYKIKKVYTSRRSEVEEYLPDAQIVDDLENIVNDDEINLVILCGPNHTHYEQAKKFLMNGKHVVVEKPFVVDSKDGQELIELAKKKNLILTVFHNRRWDSDFLTVKKLLDEGRFGKISQFESHFDRWRPVVRENKWKEKEGVGTGILFDLGSHLIDQCLVLFGMPDEVFADLDDQKNNHGVVDYFHIILKYKKMRAIVHSSSFALTNVRFSVFSDKANFIKKGLDPQEESMMKGELPSSESFGIENREIFGELYYENQTTVIESERGQYLTFYQRLADAIVKTDFESIPVTAKSALDVIKVIEASLDSSNSKTWVKIERPSLSN